MDMVVATMFTRMILNPALRSIKFSQIDNLQEIS